MRIDRFRLNSTDPAALADFYRSTFAARDWRGGEQIEFAPAQSAETFAGNETGFQHFAIVVADIDAAYAHLRTKAGWRPISLSGPERLPRASGRGAAFKFRDPDGHPLELLQFASDAIPSHWAEAFDAEPDRLFHGLDHSALTVSDAQRSLAFYENLGFVCAHRQVNAGAEQRRLDGFADVVETRVEILSLSPPDGSRPGIELLAYSEPAVVRREAQGGSTAATAIVLEGKGVSPMRDPDGHRV